MDVEGINYVVDTYAWVEYLRGTKGQADDFKTIIELGMIEGIVITPTLVLAELKRIYMKKNIAGFEEDLKEIKSRSEVVDIIDEETAIKAGELRNKLGEAVRTKKQIGMIDCLLLAIAMKFKAKVITGEDHFKKIAYPDKFGISSTIGNLKEFVVYIGE